MTACTQPRCTGTILDGYCELCGSPAGAPPFIPADAPASAAPCTQPGCAGTILDGYCDVCGSPSDAVPLLQTATLGAAAPSAADGSGKSEELAEGTRNAAALEYRMRVEQAQLPDEVRVAALREVDKLERTVAQSPECVDIRIWLDTILDLPWGTKVTDWTDDIQESREVEATLQGLIMPTAAAAVMEPDTAEVEAAAAEAEQPDTAEVEPKVAEPDTAEVEPKVAEPDTAKVEAAEVDTVEGEAEQPDTAEVEPAAAEIEKADVAPAGPRYDDTVETPAPSAGPHLGPQLPEQQAVVPVLVQPPAKKRRRSVPIALVAAALVVVLVGAFFVATRNGSVTPQSAPTATATVSAQTTKPAGTGGAGSPIQLARLPATGRPFQAVQIQGTYRGGPDTLLRVQREEAGGVWVDFPTPTVTDASGRFTTYVELGQPGRYRLRMLDPASGMTSATFALLIKG